MMSKLAFKGIIISVQPRIRMIRSFDERSHNYLGYSLLIKGVIDNVSQSSQKKLSKIHLIESFL